MDLLAIILALGLVVLNGFFVATEFAIVKLRPTQVDHLIQKQRPGARTVRKISQDLDAHLSACQLGITIASLGLGWIGEPAFARLLAPLFDLVGIVDDYWIHGISIAFAFFLITFLHITIGELAPKSIALMRPEAVSLAVAYPLRLFYILFYPAIWSLNACALWMVRAAGVQAPKEHSHLPSPEELTIIFRQARTAGLLSVSRSDVLRRAMTLSDKPAHHLMVPRNEVAYLDVNLTLEENFKRVRNVHHSRYPLCNRELDDVIGIVDIREALFKTREGQVDLRSLAQPVAYLPELMSGERLLAEFRDRHLTMAVIVDEYGGASGIVTPADIVTAVMGEFDEPDDQDVVKLPGGGYDVDGTAMLEEVEEALKVKIATDDMRTVGGFLMERLGRMPRPGDRVVEGPFLFNVVEVSGPRIQRVRIQRASAAMPKKPAKNS